MPKDLTRLSAVELARLIRTRKLSPVEVTQAHLAAIERVNPRSTPSAPSSRKSARLARSGRAAVKKRGKLGPLHGVPVAIKDLTATADMRTTFGSTLFRDHIPTEDAEVVRRLKSAAPSYSAKPTRPNSVPARTPQQGVRGDAQPLEHRAVCLGLDRRRSAALAARMTPLAEGTDFGQPAHAAAFCGVVGLRTTAGLVTRQPVTLPWHDQSVTGPMARSAEDCALLLDAMTGFTLKSPLSPRRPGRARATRWRKCDLAGPAPRLRPRHRRIGVDRDIERLCRSAALALRDARATLDEIEINMSDGRDAFSRCAEKPWSATTSTSSSASASWATTRRNIRRACAHRDRHCARRAQAREIWHRWRACSSATIWFSRPRRRCRLSRWRRTTRTSSREKAAELHGLDRPDLSRLPCGAACGERAAGSPRRSSRWGCRSWAAVFGALILSVASRRRGAPDRLPPTC